MPGGDRTGPMGQGAMTGGGRGYCNPSERSAFRRSFSGRGFFCRGRAMGFRRFSRFNNDVPEQASSSENEAEYLRREAKDLEVYLSDIKSRLTNLEKIRLPKNEGKEK